MGDLAPRDVVAGAIDARLRADRRSTCVYLDARGIDGFGRRFPTVTAACRAAGIDPIRQPIPVAPGRALQLRRRRHRRARSHRAARAVRRGRGRPAPGMHGANRLASNSLLEGLVVGGRAGRAAAEHAALLGRVRATAAEPAGCRGAGSRRAAAGDDAATPSVVRDADGLDRLDRQTVEPRRPGAVTTRGRLRGRRTDRRRPRGGRRGAGPRPRAAAATTGPTTRDAAAAPARSLVVRLDAGLRRAGRGAGGGLLMALGWPRLTELAEARATIARARSTRICATARTSRPLATVPADAVTTASLITREPGVIAGVDVALLVLDEVLGADGYRVIDRVDDGARLEPGASALTVEAADARPVDRRAHTAEPGVPPVRDRHRDRGLGGRGARHRNARSATPARRCPVCVPCRSTRSGSAVASTTGSASATRR